LQTWLIKIDLLHCVWLKRRLSHSNRKAEILTAALCMMQDVVGMSFSVQTDGASQTIGCVMETTTVGTMPMNRTVEASDIPVFEIIPV